MIRQADAPIDVGICGILIDFSIDFQCRGANIVPFHHSSIKSFPLSLCERNSCYRSYQRFRHINETNGSFSIVLTHKPRPHVASNKTRFVATAGAATTAIQ